MPLTIALFSGGGGDACRRRCRCCRCLQWRRGRRWGVSLVPVGKEGVILRREVAHGGLKADVVEVFQPLLAVHPLLRHLIVLGRNDIHCRPNTRRLCSIVHYPECADDATAAAAFKRITAQNVRGTRQILHRHSKISLEAFVTLSFFFSLLFFKLHVSCFNPVLLLGASPLK